KDDGLVADNLVHRPAGCQLDAIAGADRRTIRRIEVPAIELAASHAIGEAQRLNGRRKGDHGEIGYQQKSDLLRQLRRQRPEHGSPSSANVAQRTGRSGSPASLRTPPDAGQPVKPSLTIPPSPRHLRGVYRTNFPPFG